MHGFLPGAEFHLGQDDDAFFARLAVGTFAGSGMPAEAEELDLVVAALVKFPQVRSATWLVETAA